MSLSGSIVCFIFTAVILLMLFTTVLRRRMHDIIEDKEKRCQLMYSGELPLPIEKWMQEEYVCWLEEHGYQAEAEDCRKKWQIK